MLKANRLRRYACTPIDMEFHSAGLVHPGVHRIPCTLDASATWNSRLTHTSETHVHVVLVAPEIPPNTGSIARLCAATNTPLHLIEPLGFRIDDKHLRRAGLDYWQYVNVRRYPSWTAFVGAHPAGTLRVFSARTNRSYTSCRYGPDDFLVFGSESNGLPQALRDAYADELYSIPIHHDHVRSLNVATAVAIVLYEALRQLEQR